MAKLIRIDFDIPSLFILEKKRKKKKKSKPRRRKK